MNLKKNGTGAQRINGGAGPNTCVTKTNKVLKVSMYEAHFCCTMRYAEGLLYYNQRKDWFSISDDEKETTDEYGRHFIGDRLLVQYKNKIVPIFSLNTIKKEEAENIELKVIY